MILLNLIGGIALLLWGTSMVKTGVLRTFGGALRRMLAMATAGPARAAAAGFGAAAGLQSSTAVAMLLSAFVSRGMIALAPALAVMLGADLGTTLVVQVLAFDLAAVVPVLLATGAALALIARSNRARQIGRIVLGFGLMILALGLIVEASEPMRESEVLHLVLERFGADPVLALLIGAALTWLFHSSVAFVLFAMSLAGAGVIGLPLAVILVLGANLGSGLVPIGLTAGSPTTARRVLYGNLAFRAGAAILALALVAPLAVFADDLPGGPERQVAHVHTLFNLTLLVVCLPLTRLAARLLESAFPEADHEAGLRPHRLDDALLDRPSLALTAATRELLGMADTLETMLRRTAVILETGDDGPIEEIRALEQSVDLTHEDIQDYLVRLLRTPLDAEQHGRVVELLLFATNLEHVGDIIDKGLVRAAQKKQRLEVDFSPEGWRDLRAYHARVLDQLRLALTVFVTRDGDSARELVAEKDRRRALEVEATERHLERLREGTPASIETSGLHLDILRDLKRIVAHLTAVAVPLLEEQGVLRATRLKSDKKAKKAGIGPRPAADGTVAER
jgi:phosphate:Na+ symporter